MILGKKDARKIILQLFTTKFFFFLLSEYTILFNLECFSLNMALLSDTSKSFKKIDEFLYDEIAVTP